MKLKAMCTIMTDLQMQGNRFGTVMATIYDDDSDTILAVLDVDVPLSAVKNQVGLTAALRSLTVARAAQAGYTLANTDVLSML